MNKYRIFLLLLLAASFVLAGCGVTQETSDADFVNRQQEWYRLNQPLTFYTWSLELSEAQQIYDARNEARSTFSYSFSDFGSILFTCPSVGFPLPYGVQLTNPWRTVYQDRYDSAVIAQAEPNGLYTTGITTSSTWYLCVRTLQLVPEITTTENAPVYSEPSVMSFPFPVVEINGRLVDILSQASSVIIDLTRPANIPREVPGLPPNVPVK